ncbi:MAG: M23 family metallopeptidase [Cyclobacteriaceae bacterium]|nr:M23 family metallopeptidase [Cyclobacteriaceae bacterium]
MKNFWNFRLSRFVLLLALPGLAAAQSGDPEPVSETASTTYLFPINPGQPNYLAGTMGELRSSHFHGGIDIRTNNRIGIPVLSTREGYVSRAQVSAFGYGTVLYVTHPDGKVSVYGHLDKITGKLGAMVKREQYRRKTFEINLQFQANEFPVQRGDTIGLSGNTGSSQGPHLHFEIREDNHVLNPLKFGFTEVKDNIPPSGQKVALKTLDLNSRINDRFGRFEFTLVKRSNQEYVLPFPILAYGRIGVEILGNDRMDASTGRCGINYIEMDVDSQKVFSQYIERVDLEETRGILALMDYKTSEMRGKRFNKLYVDDGNRLPFYLTKDNGIITVRDTDRQVNITLKDESGNTSAVRFRLKKTPPTSEIRLSTSRTARLDYEVMGNTLVIESKPCENNQLDLFEQGKKQNVPVAYRSAQQVVYLIDLNRSLPDSVVTCTGTLTFHFKDVVPSATEYTYYSDHADVRFPARALYDTLFLNATHYVDDGREFFVIGNRTTPLHQPIQVTLKPTLPQFPARNLAVYRREGLSYHYVGGDWVNGKVKFNTQELGEFTFLTDTIAPSINRIRLDRNGARFRIRDGRSGIAYYEASLNGEWVLMAYDFKFGTLQSDKLDPKKPFKGDFELKVVDRAGNERIFKQKIL